MESAIDRLCAYVKLDVSYADAFGAPTVTPVDARLGILRALGYDVHDEESAQRALDDALAHENPDALLPVYVVREGELHRLPQDVRSLVSDDIPLGYHDVKTPRGATRVIVVPSRSYVPPHLHSHKEWGFATQLYSLRSQRDWGIGDYTDLARFAEIAARAGASTIALNPLHQSHLANPASASPYAPLSRRYLNALYIDVDAAARRCGVAIQVPNVEPLRASALIDYRGVSQAKMRALEDVFAAGSFNEPLRQFMSRDPGLYQTALYEAIAEHMSARDPNCYSWTQWPAAFRDCKSAEVAAFGREHRTRVEFFSFLQWLADEQLGAAARAASVMSIGLYRDLAVGVDLASADVWSDPSVYLLGLSVGAPPDPLNVHGQNWGLPPFDPRVLVERAYEPYVSLLRANMRHAGALRIDHVMGLRRLFCVERANPRAGGAYVSYDFDATLGVLSLESHLHRCMIVGEDLGTVPEGFRERIADAGVFMCRVLPFERERDGRFRAPDEYPRGAVASTGTHDLPPLAGLWTETGRVDRGQAAQLRERLLDALEGAGLLDQSHLRELRAAGASPSDAALTALLVATYRYLGRTQSELALVQLEDALGMREQVNVPGTVDEEPNWQRKLPQTLETIERHPIFAAIAQAMRDERPLNERGH